MHVDNKCVPPNEELEFELPAKLASTCASSVVRCRRKCRKAKKLKELKLAKTQNSRCKNNCFLLLMLR